MLLWIVGYSVLVVGSLAVLGLLAWRVVGALKEFGRAAEASEGRINEMLPALEAAVAAADHDRSTGRHRNGRHG